MAKYAFASGLSVPPSAVQVIESFSISAFAKSTSGRDADVYAVSSNRSDSRQLFFAHRRLSQIVAPATPRVIIYLQREAQSKSPLRFLGPVPLVRHMMLAAILCLVLLLALSLSPDVNLIEDGKSLLDPNASGPVLLLNELFLLAAAGLGASFAALFRANRYIARGKYDHRVNSCYWIQFVLGLIAGLVLAELVPLSNASLQNYAKPILLALLGGFSATVVYHILERLLEAAESLVCGEATDIIEAQEQLAKARLNQERVQHRLQLAARLTQLRQQLDAAASSDQLKQEVERMINSLMPFELEVEQSELQTLEPETVP